MEKNGFLIKFIMIKAHLSFTHQVRVEVEILQSSFLFSTMVDDKSFWIKSIVLEILNNGIVWTNISTET